MRKVFIFTLLALAMGTVGCKDNVFKPNAVISGVSPDFSAVGRTNTVTIEGEFTNFTAVTVDNVFFAAPGTPGANDGITVDAVTVVNEETIVVDITTSPSATVGPRDIEVAGELFSGVFQVRRPYDIGPSSTIAPGRIVELVLLGNGTDWAAGISEVTYGADIYGPIDGNGLATVNGLGPILLTPTFFREDLAVVRVWVSPFAAPGLKDIGITGVSFDDNVSLLDVPAPAPQQLADGQSLTITIDEEWETGLVQATVPPDKVFEHTVTTSGTGFALVFDPNITDTQAVGLLAYGDTPPFPGLANATEFGDAASKSPTIVIFDEVLSLASISSGIDPDTYPTTMDHTISGEVSQTLVAGTAVTGQTVVNAIDTNWFDTDGNETKWYINNLTATPGASMTANSGILVNWPQTVLPPGFTGDINGKDSLLFSDFAANTVDTARVVTGGLSDSTFVGVIDVAGQIDAASEFDILNTLESPLDIDANSTLHDSNNVNLAISEVGTPQVTSTLAVAGAGTIEQLYFAIDIDHTYQNDIVLTLTDPGGGVTQVICAGNCNPGVGASGNGIVQMYYDGTDPFVGTLDVAGALDAFNGLAADGTWTLTIDDTFGGDGGLLNGWALWVDPV